MNKSTRELREGLTGRTKENITLETLREMRLISNTNRRPRAGLTDETWQKEFAIQRLYVTPTKEMKLRKPYYSEERMATNEADFGKVYDGPTNWQSYCLMILSRNCDQGIMIIAILFIRSQNQSVSSRVYCRPSILTDIGRYGLIIHLEELA